MKTSAIVLLFALSSFSVAKWVKTRLPDGVTVSVPEELAAMTVEDMAQRFPSVRAPLGAFTDVDRVVDFSVNISATNCWVLLHRARLLLRECLELNGFSGASK